MSGGRWVLVPHASGAELGLLHPRGDFAPVAVAELAGTAWIDAADPASSTFDLRVEAGGIRVDHGAEEGPRVEAARGEAAWPPIRFSSRVVQAVGEDRFRVLGKLTAGDRVTMATLDLRADEPLDGPRAGERLALRGTATVDLDDLVPAGIGEALRGQRVAVRIEGEARRAEGADGDQLAAAGGSPPQVAAYGVGG